MALNKGIITAAMVASAAVTGVAAQESPKIQSYAKNGAMNTLNIPMGNGEIGMNNSNGNTISGAVTLPTGACAVRLAGDVSADQKHALIALGCQLTADGSVILGGSGASEKMPGYDNVRLTGQSAFVRVDMTNLTPSVRKVFAEIIGKQANKKTLSVTDTPYMDITTQDFATFVRTIETTGVNRTTTAFSGGSSLSTGLGVEINVGRDGVMMASWHHTATRITGNSTKSNQATIGYTQYLPEQKAKASITIDTNKTITLTGEKDLGNNWSAGIAITHNPTTGNAIYGRMNYALGASSLGVSSTGNRTNTGAQQLAETIRVFTTASEYAMRDVAGLGITTQSSEKIETGKNVTDTQKVVEPPVIVVPPKPPKPPEVVDTTAPTQTSPTNLGTFTLGSSLTQTLVFDEDIATATIGSLPTGVTATRTISGKTVSVTLTVNPLTFVFSSVTQSIPFTLTVTDAANNPRTTSESASATDVAPNTPGLPSVTRGDMAGGSPIVPITNICPTGNDQFGRTITCTATVSITSGIVVSGGLSYNPSTNSIEGTIDAGGPVGGTINRTIRAVNGAAINNSTPLVNLEDQG